MTKVLARNFIVGLVKASNFSCFITCTDPALHSFFVTLTDVQFFLLNDTLIILVQ